ncbi:LOW QUALITY PROTEIN: Calcium-binding and coiled-coil domain-containing protein 2, partial [Galemys pyrenaicus]
KSRRCPTSTVLKEQSDFSEIILNSVEKFNVLEGNITYCYTFTHHFIAHQKDWTGIFRKTALGYCTFMWVTLPIDLNGESAKQQEAKVKTYDLHHTYDEYYQFCGNQDDVVWEQAEIEETEQQNKELCRENKDLKDNYVTLQKQTQTCRLNSKRSINKMLKEKVKEQKDFLETELLQLKKHNQKIFSENEKMGVQLSTQEKEMERFVQEDQDKTEQVEHVKRKMKDHEKKLKQTVEVMEQKETTAMKKYQELMDQNFSLLKRLSENKIACNSLQREREREKMEKENDFFEEEEQIAELHGSGFFTLPYQTPQGCAEINPGLVYGNPYSGVQKKLSQSLKIMCSATLCKCPSLLEVAHRFY